jgi:hypothetical protein
MGLQLDEIDDAELNIPFLKQNQSNSEKVIAVQQNIYTHNGNGSGIISLNLNFYNICSLDK